MNRNKIFISYKHAAPTADIAQALYTSLSAVSEVLDMDIYLDHINNLPSDSWKNNVDEALAECTHFIALLGNEYWVSTECRREMVAVINRFESGESVRLLFVKAEEFDPNLFAFVKERKNGLLTCQNPKINRIGDVHFLGPYDKNRRLTRVEWEYSARLSDQLAELLKGLIPTLNK